VAELAGTTIHTCIVVGSGVMVDALSNDDGVSLIINTFIPVSALAILIFVVAPSIGAHFNPVVSLIQVLWINISIGIASAYSGAQILGAVLGAIVANFILSYLLSPTRTTNEFQWELFR
jgi:glycerol uptake facilitator-like aquaporin